MVATDPNLTTNVDPRAPQPFEPMGAPGTAIFGGFILENEKDATLQGRQKYTTYSETLANISIVGAGVRFFLNMVAKAAWKVQPADESAEAKRIAKRIDHMIRNMDTPWHRVVRRAAMYRFYGFGVQEWTAVRTDEDDIGLLDVEPRACVTIEQWDVDENGRVQGVVQRSPQTSTEHYIPREKLVYLVDDSLNDSPEGLGLFRHMARAAAKLEKYELLEAWGFETDLRGIPVVRAPLARIQQLIAADKLTKEDAAALRRPLELFIDKHNKNPALGLMLDSSVYRAEGEAKTPGNAHLWDVELMKGDGGPHTEIASAIERINREMARVIGVEHMMLGSDSKGSHALSQDKTQSFGMIVDSTLVELAEQFKKDLIIRLFELNGWDKKLMPSFKTDTMQHRNIVLLTDALEGLAKAGAPLMPNDPAINEIRSLMGLTAAPDVDLEAAEELGEIERAKAGAAGGQELDENGNPITDDQSEGDSPGKEGDEAITDDQSEGDDE